MGEKPIELLIVETDNKIRETLRANRLGVSVNRLILQNILNALLAEERHVLKQLQEEEGGEGGPERG
mgnify:CR=1 FL=1